VKRDPATGLFDLLLPRLHPLEQPPRRAPVNLDEIADLLPPDRRRTPAAVLVALVPRGNDAHVLLTRRDERLSQHAGQISFPGGRADLEDGSPLVTALREAQEEVGLEPDWLRPMGWLDRYDTISGYRVTPLVAVLQPGYHAAPQPGEVAEAFEVPLGFLRDPRNLERREIDYRGRRRGYVQFRYGAHTIWGATAAILLDLAQRMGEMD